MMSQMLEKFSTVELVMNKLQSPTEGMTNAPREDILIAGYGDSAEIFSWETNGWCEVAKMNKEHAGASSFIYNGQLFVVGATECDSNQQHVIQIGGYDDDDVGETVSNLISEL